MDQLTYKEEIIFSTEQWILRRSYNAEKGTMVLVKDVLEKSPESKAKLLYEYTIATKQNTNWLLKPLSIENALTISYEDFHGVPLQQFLKQPLSLPQFLAIAIELTNACLSVHQKNILYSSFHPINILVNPVSLRIKLLSNEYMSYMESDGLSSTENPYSRLETISYLAPEQTGRLNWDVDVRADLYSLGVIFYEMLSGRKLFEGLSAVDIIYKIITNKPAPLIKVKEDIPQIISDVIEKLIEKNPESRYQSALGLYEDLVKLQKLLMEEKSLSGFPLAEKDVQTNIRHTLKLYGREQQLNQLHSIFEKVEKGEKRLVFISGDSGIGKSSLVNELKQSIAISKGYFISSKFDQLKDDTPFAPIILLLRSLLKQIYLEGDHSVIQWTKLFEEENLQPTKQLLRSIPELSWFIKETVELFSEDYDNAKQLYTVLYSSVQKIFMAFAKQRLPVVLFVDDVQWAFTQSLETLRQIFDAHSYGYIMLIIAYRDEEVSYPHPILVWQEQIDDYNSIQLDLLDLETVNYWMADIFRSQLPVIESFGRQLHYITKGNPLFLKQALISFQRHQIIYYDMENRRWNFDLSRMQQLISDERLLKFIEKRVENLNSELQRILKIISCFGKQFKFNYLLKLLKVSPTALLEALQQLIEEGFIVPLNTYYKWAAAFEQQGILEDYELQFQFVHDRIQQVAYTRFSDEERMSYHLQLGKLLEKELGETYDREKLFEVVKHYNYCKTVINEAEKEQLASWNYELGLDSKKSGMFAIALVFFNTSLELLPENHWQSHYSLSFNVYLHISECEILVEGFEKSQEMLAIALAQAKGRLDKISVYLIMLNLYVEWGAIEKGYQTGLEALEVAGIKISQKGLKLQFLKELALLKWDLQNKSDAQLLQLPFNSDKEYQLKQQLLIYMIGNTYRLNSNFAGILMLRSMRLLLKNGGTMENAVVFINYAMILKSGFDDTKGSYRFGRLAVSLIEQQHNLSQKPHIYFVFGSFINHGIDMYDKNNHYLKLAQQYGNEIGNKHFVAVASSFVCVTMLIGGQPLDDIAQEIERQRTVFTVKNDVLSYDYVNEFEQWIMTLKEPDVEEIWNYPYTRQDDDSAKIMHLTLRLKMSYLLENHEQAAIIIKELEQPIKDTFSLIITPYYYYYRALWQLKWLQQGNCSAIEKTRYMKEIKQSIQKLKKWSKNAPQNYEHLYMLLRAEQISLKGVRREAIYYYDRAVQFARIHGYIHDEAVSCERAANYYASLNDEKMVNLFIQRAAKCMQAWGAPRVIKRWAQQYHTDFSPVSEEKEIRYASFDVMNVIEMSNTISQAIKMEDLLQKLLSTILKQAGATRGYFIQKLDTEYSVVAMAESNQTKFILYQSKPLWQFDELLQSIVRYCVQSGEDINIQNALAFRQFPTSKGEEKSVLCLPIWHKGAITAVLYLENNVSWNAFNEDKVELLKMISTQISVALENARVYEDLEKRVEERTKELALLNTNLKEVNNRLQKNEIERKKILHSISHELRSPITSAIGYVEAILDGIVRDEEQQRVYLHKSKERLLSLNRLIQDLFDLANLEAGRMEFSFSKIAVQSLFDETVSRFEDEIKGSGLVFSYQYRLNPNVFVMADERRIEQVLMNLIRNAMKYTKHGTIHFEIVMEADKCIFSLADNGIGITSNEIPFVFDSYFGGSNNEGVESHGIGLAICKQIITQHGGKIYVESIENKGSKFSFTLPVVVE